MTSVWLDVTIILGGIYVVLDKVARNVEEELFTSGKKWQRALLNKSRSQQ